MKKDPNQLPADEPEEIDEAEKEEEEEEDTTAPAYKFIQPDSTGPAFMISNNR